MIVLIDGVAAASGGVHGEGELVDRPLVPSAGDSFTVTSGLLSGDEFLCLRDGVWTFVGRGKDQRFAAGQGFELVSPGSSPNAGTSVASYQANGVGRISAATAGTIHDATGCLIRRGITWGAQLYRAQVRLVNRSAYTGSVFGGLYLSNASGSSTFFVMSGTSGGREDEIIAGNWDNLYDPQVAGAAPWDGDTVLTLQVQVIAGSTRVQVGFMRGETWVRPFAAFIAFAPSFVGVGAVSDGPGAADFDFADFSVESFG